ncbi:hypothetical protein GOQ27_07000 [Clostridium sp. D2Q-11]|uniref:Uncharacterized protein n=1 Tax=Anaeromonas frigoriresistens TaxID=2683708 RepID=A0A942UWP5_9FIRM|nr:hypothetical protein [Anaeromonas frigoriresistens]MBS4538204.1 hypothetical protein [Anaeromonas frigoriresistens]
MGLFSKKNKDDNVVSTQVKFFDGLDLFFKGELVELSYNKEEKKVIIESKFKDKRTGEKKKANLSVDKIKRAEFLNEQEIIEKQKSVGGRAVVGALALGPLGAVIGGMTGIGKKEKKGKLNQYIIINYDEDKVLSFELPPTNFSFIKVMNAINNDIKVESEIEL